MYGKTNEQYLSELQKGGRIHNLLDTPYPDLFILFETRNEDNSYRDEDGDWVHSTNSVISREAFIKKEGEKYSFLIDYWFDEIDNFSSGLYAKVRLGQFYNLINPLGDFLFSNWYGKIEFHGNNLIYCYEPQRTDGVCSVYNRRGQLLLEGVLSLALQSAP